MFIWDPQDDYLDCYGDPAVTGKVGTDIEENKCSWLVIQALQRATPEQREILEVRDWMNIKCTGNFRGRKLSRISQIWDHSWKFSSWVLRGACMHPIYRPLTHESFLCKILNFTCFVKVFFHKVSWYTVYLLCEAHVARYWHCGN